MGGLGEKRDRVRQVPAGGLDYRKASENHQRDEEPTLADLLRMTMGMVAVARRAVAVPVLMIRMRGVARVVIAVMLVRVWHELGSP